MAVFAETIRMQAVVGARDLRISCWTASFDMMLPPKILPMRSRDVLELLERGKEVASIRK
jgi:hypothetical protein